MALAKTKKALKLITAFSILASLLFFSLKEIKGQATVVRVEPQTQTVEANDEATVDINIIDVSGLYGFQFDIRYDSNILEFLSLERGSFIGDSDSTHWLSHDTSTPGLIKNIAVARTTPGIDVSGSGNLVRIRFRAIVSGNSPITIENLALSDMGPNEIPSTAQNGEIVVAGEAVPPPIVDLKANGSDGPITIDYNTSVILEWSSSNADSCEASGDWSGSKPTSGSEPTGNLTSSKTYTLTCTGENGSDSDSVTVNVGSQPTLSVDLEAIPSVGSAPLNNVDLRATVSGTATGTINYKFDCTNDGTWELEVEASEQNPYTAIHLCNYPSEGNYTARVLVERDAVNPVENTATIAVTTPTTEPNTVRVVPSSQTVDINDEPSVDIDIVEISGLYGFQFDLSYDPTILEYVSLEKGTFIGDTDSVFWQEFDTSTPGLIKNIAATRIVPGVSVSGSGTLVRITFKAIDSGTSPIRIENLALSDMDANEISSTAQDGEIIVAGPDLSQYNDCLPDFEVIELGSDFGVCGKDCFHGKKSDCPPEKKAFITVSKAGRYTVHGVAVRGQPDRSQAQKYENYYIEINGQEGVKEERDDTDPYAYSVRLEYLGDFNMRAGNNLLVMHTLTTCPPAESANSVSLRKLCLKLKSEITPKATPPKKVPPVSVTSPVSAENIKELADLIINFAFYTTLVVGPLMILVGAFYLLTGAGMAAKIVIGKKMIFYGLAGSSIMLFIKALFSVMKRFLGGK